MSTLLLTKHCNRSILFRKLRELKYNTLIFKHTKSDGGGHRYPEIDEEVLVRDTGIGDVDGVCDKRGDRKSISSVVVV
jgi:hypothetical protein